MKSPCLPGLIFIKSAKSMPRITELIAQFVLPARKERFLDYYFFCHGRIIAPAHVFPITILCFQVAICAIDWLSCTATIQTGVSFFLTGVQLVEEPSAPLRHYFVLSDKLGHSGLPSHGFWFLCERSLTF